MHGTQQMALALCSSVVGPIQESTANEKHNGDRDEDGLPAQTTASPDFVLDLFAAHALHLLLLRALLLLAVAPSHLDTAATGRTNDVFMSLLAHKQCFHLLDHLH